MYEGCSLRPDEGVRPLELELQVGVSYLMWLLELTLGSCRRTANTLGHRAISDPYFQLFSLKQRLGV